MIGVYFETWACKWGTSSETCDLSKMNNAVTHVFLAFCQPDCVYKKGQYSWSGTGLQFSSSWNVIKGSIQLLQKRNVKVLLSVGGATYSNWNMYHLGCIMDLCADLGLDGIDIDYEPDPIDSSFLIKLLQDTRSIIPKTYLLSIAAVASGCLLPREGWRGSMIDVLLKAQYTLDFINLMNYDGGKTWDYKAAYQSYRENFTSTKPICFGFEVGKQGWGDAYTTLEDIKIAMSYVKPGDGYFIWAYFSQGSPNCNDIVNTIYDMSKGTPPQPPVTQPVAWPITIGTTQSICCKKCGEWVASITYK